MFNSELSSTGIMMRKPGRIPSISESNSIMEGREKLCSSKGKTLKLLFQKLAQLISLN